MSLITHHIGLAWSHLILLAMHVLQPFFDLPWLLRRTAE
jgi:hypothetical protein